MNQVFSPGRFGLTFKKYVGERRRQFAIYLIVFFGVMVAMWFVPLVLFDGISMYRDYAANPEYYDTSVDPFWRAGYFAYMFALFALGAISASMAFSSMASKEGRISTMMTPASTFEKWLTRFLVYIVLFSAVYTLFFYISDGLRVGYIRLFTDYGSYAGSISLYETFNGGGADDGGILGAVTFSSFLMVISTFTLGSAIWPKRALVYTIAACFVLNIIFMSLSFPVLFSRNEVYDINLTSEEGKALILSVSALFSAFLFWLCYLRFKESEVIERW